MTHFNSSLGLRIEAFLALKRAMGRRYQAAEAEMRRFDRHVAGLGGPTDAVTRELVHNWLSAKPHVCPATQRSRVGILRQFCRYLVRLEPRTYVPDRALFPARLPIFKGHVYSQEELRELLRAALGLSPLRRSLHPLTVYTMLLTLYATGLRAGEVGRLRVAEVDLDARTLFVRDTKFFKSRLVPFSAGLADQLRSYLEARAARSSANPQAPFFINRHRRAFAAHKLSWIFHRLVATIAVARRPGARGPRLHDVRRTFAVHRVLRWYREGADVQAKLPLLATYMGHGSVLSTHVYLTATAELLREASGRFERAYGPLVAAPEEIRHEAR